MKAFACGDVVPGCDARWARPTEEDLLHELAEHAAVAHGIVRLPDELLATIRAAIVDGD